MTIRQFDEIKIIYTNLKLTSLNLTYEQIIKKKNTLKLKLKKGLLIREIGWDPVGFRGKQESRTSSYRNYLKHRINCAYNFDNFKGNDKSSES